jgi:hypothetical protein
MANKLKEIRTHKDVQQVVSLLERTKHQLALVKEQATIAAGRAIHASESIATSFGFGYARGRYAEPNGEWEMMGLPPDLTVGVLGLGTSFLGLFGKYDDHVAAIGTGAISAFATVKGMEMGDAAQKADKTPATKGSFNSRPATSGAWKPGRSTVNAG